MDRVRCTLSSGAGSMPCRFKCLQQCYEPPRIQDSIMLTRELLIAMLRQPHAWYYGYELSKQTGLKSGTLYPLLIRLSDQGLLQSKWQEPERPGRPTRHALQADRQRLGISAPLKRQTRHPLLVASSQER